jgi:hypothetical protein
MDLRRLLEGPDHASLVQQWQKETSPATDLDDRGMIEKLFDACVKLFLANLPSLKPRVSKSTYRKMERSCGTLRIWGSESGAANGFLDKRLFRSKSIQRITEKALLNVALILSGREFIKRPLLVDI